MQLTRFITMLLSCHYYHKKAAKIENYYKMENFSNSCFGLACLEVYILLKLQLAKSDTKFLLLHIFMMKDNFAS